MLQEHDPAAGDYGSRIVVHGDREPLTSLSSQMAQSVGELQRLPHVLSLQNPLPPPGEQPSQPSGQ